MNSTLQIALGVTGALGFILALSLAYVEYRRYGIPLRMKIIGLMVAKVNNRVSVIFVHLTFLNQSSRGRTVCYLMQQPTIAVEIADCQKSYQLWQGQTLVNCEYPSDNETEIVQMLPGMILELPLDILPHQSQAKWCPFLVLWNRPIPPDVNSVVLELEAQDISRKPIASCREKLSLSDLKKEGTTINYPFFNYPMTAP